MAQARSNRDIKAQKEIAGYLDVLDTQIKAMAVESWIPRLSEKQLEAYGAFHSHDFALVACAGSNRSGKTAGGGLAYAEYLRDEAPTDTEHLCITTDQRLSRKNQQKLLWDLIPRGMFDVEWSGPKNGFGSINPVVILDRRTKDNPQGRNVVVHFMTQTEYENNSDAFEGLTIETAWIDEAVSHEVFSGVSARCSLSDDGRILVTAIPGADWFHEVIYNAKPEDKVWFRLFEPFDNPTMTEEKWARFASRVPPHERDVRLKGVPAMAGALVYTEFDRRPREDGGHVVRKSDIPDDVVWFAGHDVGMDHPTAVVFFAMDKENRIWVADEYVARNTTIEDDIEQLNLILGDRKLKIPAVIDPAAFQISKANQLSVAAQYVAQGWPVFKALRTQDYGERAMVYQIKEMFAHGEIMVCEHCTEFIRELSVWKYRRDQRNRPVTAGSPFEDRNNDLCVAPWTEVLTPDGWTEIRHLEGTTGFVWTPFGWSWYDRCDVTRRNADIYRLATDHAEVYATDDHPFLSVDGWRRLGEFQAGDALHGPDRHFRYEADAQRKALLPVRPLLPAHGDSGWSAETQEGKVASAASGRVDSEQRPNPGWVGGASQGPRSVEQSDGQSGSHPSVEASETARQPAGAHRANEAARRADSPAGDCLAQIGSSAGVSQLARGSVVEERRVLDVPMLRMRQEVPDARTPCPSTSILLSRVPERSEQAKTECDASIAGKAPRDVHLPRLRGVGGGQAAIKQPGASMPAMRQPSGNQTVSAAPTYAGVSDVYDLHVPGVHCFVVRGGLIAHNCDAFRYALSVSPRYATGEIMVLAED